MAVPVALTGAGNLTSAFSQTAVNTLANNKPANTAVGDLLVTVVASQNNSNVTSPGATGWTRVGPAYNVTGDSTRRPSGLYVLPVTNQTVLDALPASWTWSGPTGTGRWVVITFRVTGADLENYASWAYSEYNTDSAAASATRNLASFTVTGNDRLGIGFYSTQTASVAAPVTMSWGGGMTEIAEVPTLTSTTATHQVTGVATQELDSGATGTRTVTFSSNPASASGYWVAIPEPSAPVEPAATPMRVIAHRGTPSSAADNTEEQITGLDILAGLRRPVNGVEVDARLSSDNVVFLCHDETIDRTSPTGGTGTLSSMTAAALTSAGIERADKYLEACVGRGFTDILVQIYAPTTQTPVTNIINVLRASTVRDRIIVMTSASNYHVPLIRAAGWTGRIGVYGMTAANWSTYSADFATYSVHVGFVPPGEYMTNRAHAVAMINAGYRAGASTEDDLSTFQAAASDGTTYILTDAPTTFLTNYEPPARTFDSTRSGPGTPI